MSTLHGLRKEINKKSTLKRIKSLIKRRPKKNSHELPPTARFLLEIKQKVQIKPQIKRLNRKSPPTSIQRTHQKQQGLKIPRNALKRLLRQNLERPTSPFPRRHYPSIPYKLIRQLFPLEYYKQLVHLQNRLTRKVSCYNKYEKRNERS